MNFLDAQAFSLLRLAQGVLLTHLIPLPGTAKGTDGAPDSSSGSSDIPWNNNTVQMEVRLFPENVRSVLG